MVLDARFSSSPRIDTRVSTSQDCSLEQPSAKAGRSRAFPVDTTPQVRQFLRRHSADGRIQEVSFRELVPWLKVGERATHYLHPYPAKLLPHIAHFFLASNELCPKNGVVLDPFGGSGTVALETCLSGREALYVDSNPLARLIASAKLSPVSVDQLAARTALLEKRFLKSRATVAPNVVNIDKWYSSISQRRLARLKNAIEQDDNDNIQQLFLATFSATARKVSKSDPRLSVPVSASVSPAEQEKKDAVWDRFQEQLNANARRIDMLCSLLDHSPKFTISGTDARNFAAAGKVGIEAKTVDLIITSPPYAGAQKYIRASSLSLGWLGLAGEGELRPLENSTIGREHLDRLDRERSLKTSIKDADSVISKIFKKNQLRASICSNYLLEMQKALRQMHVALKPGGHLVLVIGNNEVCGEEFLSSEYLTTYLLELGFEVRARLVDEIKSRGLMTKRNRTASIITREWVLIFRKKK